MPPKKHVPKPITVRDSLKRNTAMPSVLFHYADGILRHDRRQALKKSKEKVDKLVNRAVPYLSK